MPPDDVQGIGRGVPIADNAREGRKPNRGSCKDGIVRQRIWYEVIETETEVAVE